jgi:hypothetical protein
MPKKPDQYLILWAIMADPMLSSTAKNVATVLLLKFQNRKTGRCNPSISTIARKIGVCDRTVNTAIKELRLSGWLIVRGTGGGSKENTNQYDFRLRTTGEASFTGEVDCTGEVDLGTGETGRAGGMKLTADKPSIEQSRTSADDLKKAFPGKVLVEADGPEGDSLRLYWRSIGKMEPHRVGRGRFYLLEPSDPALAHICRTNTEPA